MATSNGQLQTRMPRLMDWLENELPVFPPFRTTERDRPIRCEEFVENDTFTLRAELPGIDPARDVKVTVVNGILTVVAERRETQVHSHRSEFYYGALQRSIALPVGADEKTVAATYRDGILTVTVALAPQATEPATEIPITRE